MAFGLAAYVSRGGIPLTAQDWLPGAGQLSRTGFYPQGSDKRFSTHFMWVGLLFQASWHNPDFTSRVRFYASSDVPFSRARSSRAGHRTYPHSIVR